MRTVKIAHVVGFALLFFGCSDNAQPGSPKDASAPPAEAAPDRGPADAVSPADQVDAPAPDLAKDLADAPVADLAKDLAVDVPVDQAEPLDVARDQLVAADRAIVDVARAEVGHQDTGGIDNQLAVDAQPAMDALAAVVGFPCRGDDDCCTAVDSCMARTYLYSRAPGANPKPSFPVSTGGCLACIPSSVQLRCVSGQCFGERVSSYSGSLFNAHCGYVEVPDAGAYVLFDVVVDASTPVIATKTSWTCGG